MWNAFRETALSQFKNTRGAATHVLFLIDVENGGGEQFVRSLYGVARSIDKLGDVGASADEEITRLKQQHIPCMIILPLDYTIKVFKLTRSKIAEGLLEEPPPGSVRVILIADGMALLHEPLPIEKNLN